MKSKHFFLNSTIFIPLIFLSLNSFAQQRKYVNEFLQIGVGGRGLGMSGAQVASVNDISSAFWNPAGLAYIESDIQLGAMHSEYFSGIAKYDYAAIAFPLKNRKGVLAISGFRFAVDDIPYTINLVQPDGVIDYAQVRSISAADYAGLISYARPISFKRWAERDDISFVAGGNFKIIHRLVGSMANAWGGGLDAGIQGKIGRWQVGAAVKDITTTYTVWAFSLTDREKDVFVATGNDVVSRSSEVTRPRMVLGTGRYFPLKNKLTLLGEINLDATTDGARYGNLINLNPISIDPRIGAELSYNKKLYVRAGAGHFQRILDDADTTFQKKRTLFQPTLGVGVQLKNFAFDYSFSNLNIGDNSLYSHFLSLKLDIRKKVKKAKEE